MFFLVSEVLSFRPKNRIAKIYTSDIPFKASHAQKCGFCEGTTAFNTVKHTDSVLVKTRLSKKANSGT